MKEVNKMGKKKSMLARIRECYKKGMKDNKAIYKKFRGKVPLDYIQVCMSDFKAGRIK